MIEFFHEDVYMKRNFFEIKMAGKIQIYVQYPTMAKKKK